MNSSAWLKTLSTVVFGAAITLVASVAFTQPVVNWCHNPIHPGTPPPPRLPPPCLGPTGGGGSNGGGGGAAGPGGMQPSAGAAGSGTSGAPQPPNSCNTCTGSPCLVASGNYISYASDLQIPTAGFPLAISRSYESARALDGLLGIGWSLNLTAHLYYATYLYAAPNTYLKEADVTLPSGVQYRFTENADGVHFTAPVSRYDVLLKNPDGSFDLAIGDGSTQYHFGATGRLESIRDEFGNRLVLTYDSTERLQRIADDSGSGRYLDVYYGADGRIATIQDHSGRQVNFAYGTGGTLTGVTDPAGRTVTYTYVSGRFGPLLSHIADPWGRTITDVTYDAEDRTATYTESGETYTYAYNYAGRADQSSKTDSLGNRWIYTYALAGVITQRSYPGATAEQMIYNADGSIAQSTDEVGVQTLYEYAGLGRIASITKGALGPLEVRFDYAYDSTFPTKVVSVTPKKRNVTTGVWAYDPNWQGWRYDYYPNGSPAPGALWHVYRVQSDGATAETVSTYVYNAHGQVTQVIDAAGATTDYVYDAVLNLHSATEPANNDAGTRSSTVWTYDSLGRTETVAQPGHVGSAPQDVKYVYDAVDRTIEVQDHFNDDGYATTSFAYDRFDSASGLTYTDATDLNGIVTSQGMDAYGRLLRAVDGLGAATTYAYSHGHLASITDANGNVTGYAYDPMGRLVTTTFPDGAAEHYTYAADGLLSTKTDRKAQTLTYTYDALKRLTQKTLPAAQTVTFTYAGQKLAAVSDHTTTPAETHSFTYDSSFRVQANTQATRGTIAYTYTATDAVLTTAVTGGASTAYTYYPNGSLNTIAWSPVTGTFKYEYTPSGQYATITFPDQQTRVYGYDEFHRLVSVENLHPNVSQVGGMASFSYGYDVDELYGVSSRIDQRSTMTAVAPGYGPGTTRYKYDDAYQLTAVGYPFQGSAPHAPGTPGSRDDYTYDAIGNRTNTHVIPQCSPPVLCPGPVDIPYTYEKMTGNTNNWQRLLSASTDTYTSDANGNVATRAGRTFTWDAENRLRTIASGGSTLATYRYDYQGRRSEKAVGATTGYLYDGLNLIGEGSSLPVLGNEYLFGPAIDEPLAMKTAAGAVAYYDVDALGSVVLVNDPTGAAVNTYSYDAWGAEMVASETAPQPFRYTAREKGEEGLLYYRARYYDPSVGRFLGEDPLRFRTDRNFYRYVINNPAVLRDPHGLDGEVLPFTPPPPGPTGRGPFDCDDIRPFDPNRVPLGRRTLFMDPKRIVSGGGRMIVVAVLAAINIKVWSCAIARNFCLLQSTGLSFCECMRDADSGNHCSQLPAGKQFDCSPPKRPEPPAPRSCCSTK
jgi:RHS repeat-associated protein